MELVDAMNIVIQHGAGVRPVSSETDAPPGVAREIDRVRKKVFKSAQPFCTEEIDLVRNTAGEIKLEPTILGIFVPEPFIIRDQKVYDRKNRTFQTGRDFVNTPAVFDIPFVELPQSVADLIAWEAARDFAAVKRGRDSPRYVHCAENRDLAEVQLSQDYPAYSGQENPDKSGGDFFAENRFASPRWYFMI